MDGIPGHVRQWPADGLATPEKKLDVLHVMGPDTDDVLSSGLISALRDRGLNVHTYGDGRTATRNKVLKRLICDALGDNGHVVFSAHGGLDIRKNNQPKVRASMQSDGQIIVEKVADRHARDFVRHAPMHRVRTDLTSSYGSVPTASLIRWVHDPEAFNGKSMRMAHLISCDADEVLRQIRPGSAEWRSGYTLIYGAPGTRIAATNATSLEVALSYLAECREKNKVPHPLVLFARAGLARGDAMTLIGGDLEGPVTFTEPTRLADLDNNNLAGQLSGSKRDIVRIKVAVAVEGETDFEFSEAHLLRDYVFTRMLRNDVSGVRTALETYPELAEATDQTGDTLLYLAASLGRQEIAELLILSGADPNRQDNQDGVTPLMEAARSGNQAMARLLLKLGANPTLQDIHGQTAPDYAYSKQHDELGNDLAAVAARWAT